MMPNMRDKEQATLFTEIVACYIGGKKKDDDDNDINKRCRGTDTQGVIGDDNNSYIVKNYYLHYLRIYT